MGLRLGLMVGVLGLALSLLGAALAPAPRRVATTDTVARWRFAQAPARALAANVHVIGGWVVLRGSI